jgi:hypothetical protein
LLRGFDQQIADIIGSYMEGHGVRFQRGYVPIKVERIEEGSPGKLKVCECVFFLFVLLNLFQEKIERNSN